MDYLLLRKQLRQPAEIPLNTLKPKPDYSHSYAFDYWRSYHRRCLEAYASITRDLLTSFIAAKCDFTGPVRAGVLPWRLGSNQRRKSPWIVT